MQVGPTAPNTAHAVPPSTRTTTTPTEIEATPLQTYRDRAQTNHLLEEVDTDHCALEDYFYPHRARDPPDFSPPFLPCLQARHTKTGMGHGRIDERI